MDPEHGWFEEDVDGGGLPPSWSSGARRERRRYGRSATHVPLWEWVQNASLEFAGCMRVPIMVCDISLGGVRFEAYVRLSVGSEAVVHIDVPGRRISVPCRVTWFGQIGAGAEDDRRVYGCSFLMVSPRDAQDLVNGASELKPAEEMDGAAPTHEDCSVPIAA